MNTNEALYRIRINNQRDEGGHVKVTIQVRENKQSNWKTIELHDTCDAEIVNTETDEVASRLYSGIGEKLN